MRREGEPKIVGRIVRRIERLFAGGKRGDSTSEIEVPYKLEPNPEARNMEILFGEIERYLDSQRSPDK
jgi:hypothetical protein